MFYHTRYLKTYNRSWVAPRIYCEMCTSLYARGWQQHRADAFSLYFVRCREEKTDELNICT